MSSKRDPHVVDLQGDRITPEQPFMKNLNPGTLDQAELQQPPLQLTPVFVLMVMIADLDDYAPVATPGFAEPQNPGHGTHARQRPDRRPC